MPPCSPSARLPPLCNVTVDIASLHYDERLWPDPERFDPLRFSPATEAALPGGKRHPCAFLGFGQGARSCLGKAMGMLSLQVCVGRLLQDFSFHGGEVYRGSPPKPQGYMDVTFEQLPFRLVPHKI